MQGLPDLAQQGEYLPRALGFLLEFQFDSQLQQVSESLLQHADQRVRQITALHAASLAVQRGNFDGAEVLITSHRLARLPEGILILSRADFERGYPELAQARLDTLINTGFANGPALALAAEIQQRSGKSATDRLTDALRIADDPLSHQPRLARLQKLIADKNLADLASEFENYLRLFSNDQTALLALGDFAANNGLPDLARRLQPIFAQHHWQTDALSLLYAEACIHAARYADGLSELNRYLQENPTWAVRYGPAVDGLRAVALYGLNRADDAQLQLEHLLGQPNLRAENLIVVANRILALGHPEAARLALAKVADLDPKNQAALAALVRLEAELGYLDTLPAHLGKFLAVRRPSREVLALAYRRIGSDLNLLQPDQQRLLSELRQRLGRDAFSAPRS